MMPTKHVAMHAAASSNRAGLRGRMPSHMPSAVNVPSGDIVDSEGAYLGRKDVDSAMADLNAVLGKQPDNADGLLLRGIAWSTKRDYARALDDLSGANPAP